MWQTVLTAALTCLATLIVTLIFNYIVNGPKKRKAEFQSIMSANRDDLVALKAGLQAILKNDLKIRYQKWLKLGYAPEDAKDDLERMYVAYHNLGANGVMDKHREKFLNLPDKKENRRD